MSPSPLDALNAAHTLAVFWVAIMAGHFVCDLLPWLGGRMK